MQLAQKKKLIFTILIIVVILGVIFAPKISQYRAMRLSIEGGTNAMSGNFDKAEEKFNKALQIDPNFYVAHYGLGKLAIFRDDYKKAEEKLLKTLYSDPEPSFEPRIYADLASVYMLEGNYQKSVDYADKALNYDMESIEGGTQIKADAYLTGGNALLFLGEPEKAKENFDKCAELKIDDPDSNATIQQMLNNELGIMNTMLGEYEEAIDYYGKNLGTTENPMFQIFSYFGIGKCNYYLKNYEEAVGNLEKGHDLLGNLVAPMANKTFQEFQFLHELGNSSLRLGNYDEAKTYYERILEIKDGIKYNSEFEISFAGISAEIGLGDYFFAIKGNDQAIAHYNNALSLASPLKPNFFNEKINIHFFSILAHYQIGAANYSDGKIALAKKEVQEAERIISLLPENEEYFIGKMQWFDDGKNLFQKISSLKNSLQ